MNIKTIAALIVVGALVGGCTSTDTKNKKEPEVSKSYKGKKCRITGKYNWKSSHPKLTRELCKMSRKFNKTIKVTSSCRTTKSNRGVSNSMHLYRNGCKAADIVILGMKKSTALKYWAKNVGGGRGYYCGRGFVHVDVGSNRNWAWFCGKHRSKYLF